VDTIVLNNHVSMRFASWFFGKTEYVSRAIALELIDLSFSKKKLF
jgi:hypothetical protein